MYLLLNPRLQLPDVIIRVPVVVLVVVKAVVKRIVKMIAQEIVPGFVKDPVAITAIKVVQW